MPSSEINYQLQQAIALAQSGQREEARRLLQQIVSYDPTVVAAWLWLATVAATPSERIYALQQVLNLDPTNEKARAALARLGVGETLDEDEMFPFDSDDEAAIEETYEQPQASVSPPPNKPEGLLSSSELIIVVTILVAVAMIVAVLIIRGVGGDDDTPTPRFTATPLPPPTALPTITFTPSATNTYPAPRTLPPSHTPTSTMTPSLTPTFTPTPDPRSIFGG